jgi:uncharacterized protein YigA (DUF484 family)
VCEKEREREREKQEKREIQEIIGKAHANDRMSEKENVLVKIITATKRYRKVKNP